MCLGVLKGGEEGRSRTCRRRYLASVGKARVSATDEVFGNDNQHAVACELDPDTTPEDAEWGERYFHLTDPDGHEISFAKPLSN